MIHFECDVGLRTYDWMQRASVVSTN
jgi:hypothetical protein